MDWGKAFANGMGVAGVAAALLAVVTWWVMIMASAPNSSPEQLRTLKLWMWVGIALGLAGAAGAIWLLTIGRPWAALGAGCAPMGLIMGALVVLSIRS